MVPGKAVSNELVELLPVGLREIEHNKKLIVVKSRHFVGLTTEAEVHELHGAGTLPANITTPTVPRMSLGARRIRGLTHPMMASSMFMLLGPSLASSSRP
jgi:hypothetical protein